MKYLKLFEGREFTRKVKYEYLSKEDENRLEEFVEKFIIDKDKIEKIEELELFDFVEDSFNYLEIWTSILASQFYESYNIYYAVDEFCRNNDIDGGTPAIRNSLSKIVNKMYKKFGIKDKLDNGLIKIFEDQPKKYKTRFELYEDKLNSVVKSACDWMLSFQSYNL